MWFAKNPQNLIFFTKCLFLNTKTSKYMAQKDRHQYRNTLNVFVIVDHYCLLDDFLVKMSSAHRVSVAVILTFARHNPLPIVAHHLTSRCLFNTLTFWALAKVKSEASHTTSESTSHYTNRKGGPFMYF